VKRKSIQGRRVLLTGASSGIGEALAQRLLQCKARLLITARRSEPLAGLQQQYPDQVSYVCGDITADQTRLQLIAEAQRRWGAIDFLVNNAGIGAMGPFSQATPDRLHQVMAVNFTAPAELCRLSYELLKQGDQPAIMNIGSILGHRAVPWKSEYCASKFALRGLTSALRSEWKADGIDVLHLSPSTTDSPFFDDAIEDTMQRDWKGKRAMAPQRVAEIAIDAWRHGRRDVLLTPGGKALVWLDRIAPRIASWAVTRWG
jgi:short-subunit dehydrogenase